MSFPIEKPAYGESSIEKHAQGESFNEIYIDIELIITKRTGLF
jgi:hypothetical protein